LYEPTAYAGLLDTDPFVFGDQMLYTGCQQHTRYRNPNGASETALRRLGRGSVIAFGSAFRHVFVIDTIFVVAGYRDYPRGEYATLHDLDLPREYYVATLYPSALGNPSVESYRLYLGATYADPVDGMFSYAPCLPCDPLDPMTARFARPHIALPQITQELTQGKRFSRVDDLTAMRGVWDRVREQVEGAGLSLAHRILLRPRIVGETWRPPSPRGKVVGRRVPATEEMTVELVRTSEGEHYALRAPGSAAPYTRMPECHAVDLEPTDRVVDIGAYVGEFALRAARLPVAHVTAIEPTPRSFELLSRNLRAFDNATVVQAAVVQDDSVDEMPFYLARGTGTRNRLRYSPGLKAVRVSCVSYAAAIAGATVVKVDVEGAEWSYPIAQHLAAPLRALILEFHPREPEHETAARTLVEQIEAAGFTAVYPVNWERFVKHGSRWGAHGAWVR
jgi:FkbM family methyltransferase